MRTIHPSSLLRRAFVADAAASGLVALAQLADTSLLVRALGLPRGLLVETGLFLVLYALVLAALSRASRLPAALVRMIVAGNVAWALAAVALWAEGLVAPTGLGLAWLLAQAAATAVFAAWESAGLRASVAAAAAPGGVARAGR